jgi:hypothetical protein
MTASPSFELYTQRNDKDPNFYHKDRQRSTIETNFLWINVKGQRIGLDTFYESIILNDSAKHISLLHYLACDKENVKRKTTD